MVITLFRLYSNAYVFSFQTLNITPTYNLILFINRSFSVWVLPTVFSRFFRRLLNQHKFPSYYGVTDLQDVYPWANNLHIGLCCLTLCAAVTRTAWQPTTPAFTINLTDTHTHTHWCFTCTHTNNLDLWWWKFRIPPPAAMCAQNQ